MIKKYARDNYNINDPDFPCGLCNGCYLDLHKKNKDPSIVVKVVTFTPHRTLQLRSSVCDCVICKFAKAGINSCRKFKKKVGRPKQIDETNEDASISTPNTIIIVCKTCFTELYPGCRHKCTKQRYRKKKVENPEKLIASPTTSNKLAKRSRDEYDDKGQKLCSDSSPERKTKRKLFLSSKNLCTIRKNMNLSARKTKDLAHYIRVATGSRSAIEPYTDDKMKVDSHLFDDYFEYKNILFVEENSKTKVSRKFRQHAAVCKNLKELIDDILHRRKICITDALIRVGLDGGGGFLKICVSVFNIKAPVSMTSTVAKKFSDAGVKKVFIIAISPDVPENYINMKNFGWKVVSIN